MESLELLDRADLGDRDPIIDVGGGSSTFVDALLARGHRDITVLDLSASAIAEARARVEARPSAHSDVSDPQLEWIVADVTTFTPTRTYSLWHDRAVFHFLVDAVDQERYLATVREVLCPGGWLMLATFARNGPERCSGLPVRRWSAAELGAFFAPEFELVEQFVRDHHTPWGGVQPFTWVLMHRRRGDSAESDAVAPHPRAVGRIHRVR